MNSLEPLEPRIAPASITIAGKTAKWTDYDGDLVTMKWTSEEAPTFTKMDKGDGLLVSLILLQAAKHEGASITITVAKGGIFGDGRVEIGHLDGTGVALKSWNAPKVGIAELDLGKAVDGIGIGTLVSGGIGQTKIDAFTGAMGNGKSEVAGSVTLVKIIGDIGYGGVFFHGQKDHGKISITGSLRGDLPGANAFDGTVLVFGGGKSLTLGGSILNGQLSQQVGSFKTVSIGGDLVCSSDTYARNSYAAAENLSIRGSIIGGKFSVSGGGQDVKSVLIGGSLIALEDSPGSGELRIGDSGTLVKNVTVKGGLYGAKIASWALSFPEFAAGAIDIEGSVGVINIGGSIYGGATGDGTPAVNGGILVQGNVGAVNIGGRIDGSAGSPVFILAGGKAPAAGDYSAMGKLAIKGDAKHAYIAAGTGIDFDFGTKQFSFRNNPDAGIGAVKIGGNFVNSNILAGVKDGGFFGVGNTPTFDTLDVGDPARSAKLGPVMIKGYLLSDGDNTQMSGFAADSIASIVVNGRQVFKAGDDFRNFDTLITAKEL